MMLGPEDSRPGLENLPAWMQWAVLLSLSAVLTAVLDILSLPAASLIGPLICGISVGINQGTIRPPRPIFYAAQGVVGCLIAASISFATLSTIADNWLLVAAVVAATLVASSFLGWLISHWKILPGTTGVWGAAPGAASAMVLMAGAFGADQRLVAFMQYLRVLMVTVAAALVARFWVDTSGIDIPQAPWFPPFSPIGLAATIAIATVGGLMGKLLRLPSPYFIGAMILAAILHLGLDIPLELPPWLLSGSYAVIGWTVGLNFTRPILAHAARALPKIALSILTLMGFCGLLAWLLVQTLGVDPLTAYLATSPGGMDSIAIIAAASKTVDLSFIMALQAARFLMVLLLGPSMARWVARSVG